jgi:MRG-binding protein
MISIHNNMRSLGYATDDAQHTRIPGVWRKLHQLYDLHALDERENSYAFHDLPDPLDPDDAHQIPEFELPEEEFGELMWQRRYRRPGSEPSSSPPFYPIEEDKALYQPGLGLLRELPEGAKPYRAGSTSVATPTPKGNRNTRASRAATKAKGKKGGQAKNIKAQSAVSESAGEDEEVDGDEDEDQDEEESAESQVETAPSTRRTNRSGGRAKPAPKRTRKR